MATQQQQPQQQKPQPPAVAATPPQTAEFVAGVAPLVGGEAQARTFVRVVLNAVQQTPALLGADRRTLLLACMKAARDKLMPDGKEAVFNIYNTKQKVNGRDTWVEAVQYLPMVAGLIKKLYESGFVTFVDAAAVYAKDEFTYERGDAPKLVHKPTLANDPGDIVAAYVVVKLKNGETKREVMPRRDIEKVRAASKAPDGPGWKNWYDQFAIKSVIKRAYKQLPSSVELEQVIEHDNEAVGFADFAGSDAGPSAVDALNAGVQKQQGQIEHQPTHTIDTMSRELNEQTEKVATAAAQKRADEAEAAARAKRKEPNGELDKLHEAKIGGDPPISYAQIADKLRSADTPEAFAEAVDLIRHIADPTQQQELQLLADQIEAGQA
jgi:recombination protein RecT